MGGGKPTYHKPSNATKPQQGQWPALPPGHQINPKYTGKPEDYDPFFGTKMKKLREQGLIPPGSKYRSQRPQHQQWTNQQPHMMPPQWQQQQHYTPQNPYNNNTNSNYNNNNAYSNYNPFFNPYQNGGPSNNNSNSSNQGNNPNTNNPALPWPYPFMMPQSGAPKPQGN